MVVSAIEGHRLWAQSYDAALNPVLALEARTLRRFVEQLPPGSILDVASGTGRWMTHLHELGRRVFGIDFCPEMVAAANRKTACAGSTAIGDVRWLPFRDHSFDCTLCSFALGYIEDVGHMIGELARVSSRVIVTDLHPAAVEAGWSRSFRAEGIVYELQHYRHSLQDLDCAAATAGLVPEWSSEAYFAAPEHEIFAAARKTEHFHAAAGVPAVLIRAWAKP